MESGAITASGAPGVEALAYPQGQPGLATVGSLVTAGAALVVMLGTAAGANPLPFGPGERLDFKISYLHLRAGRASLSVLPAESDETSVIRFVAEARSEGFFAWLFRFRVKDRTVATWSSESGCSLALDKRLREGRAVRDQSVVFDPERGLASVVDPKIEETEFVIEPCALDVLSVLFVTRVRGVPEEGEMTLPVFDNGKSYRMAVRFLRRETLDLPLPLGRDVSTIVVEPRLAEGTGLFVKKGRLRVWLTDDARRIPVRMRSKVAVGSVAADLESYTPGDILDVVH